MVIGLRKTCHGASLDCIQSKTLVIPFQAIWEGGQGLSDNYYWGFWRLLDSVFMSGLHWQNILPCISKWVYCSIDKQLRCQNHMWNTIDSIAVIDMISRHMIV